MRSRAGDRELDEWFVVTVAIEPEADPDVAQVLTDVSQTTKDEFDRLPCNLRVTANHCRRAEHSPVFGLHRTAQQQ